MIRLRELTKRFGTTTVLDHVDFEVPKGEIAAVVGPSGAGKSTLARCVTLLERPTSGSVEIDGRDLVQLSAAELRSARRSIGTVFQSANLVSRLTVAENVALPLRPLGLDDGTLHQRVHELLDRVGLLDHASHYPAQLSGGQRQRAGIARGLALRPSVLLADEATSGLDPVATASILRLITELRDELGLTVVLITHEMDVVRSVADTVARLDRGRIVERGRLVEVLRDSDSELSRALLPVPAAAPSPAGERLWELRYGSAGVDATWLASVTAALHTDVALRSALVEQVAGQTVGRATVAVARDLDAGRVRAAFAAAGIDAQPTDQATPTSKVDTDAAAAVVRSAA